MKMNRLNLLYLLLVIVLGFSSCTGKGGQKKTDAGVEYYRNILFSETPYDLERGGHKLTADEAKTVNNYKFTRDDAGRLVSIEFMRGDSLLSYSSMGGAAKIAYEYKDNKQVKSFYNKKNERIESSGVYTAEYTLNDKGVRTGLKFFGKTGEPVENRNKINNYVWTILPDGMVKELRYNLEGKETVMNPFCPFFELRFTYNDKGYVTRMANYMADTLYNCTAENCGDIGVSYFTFKPNEAGDVENFEVFNVTGQMSNLYWGWSKRVTKYDPNGYVLETAYLDQDNEYIGGKNVPVTQYSYDAHGSVLEVKSMDKERILVNNPETGGAITQFKYDEVGNRTETILLDKDNNPVPEKK
jgi:YD repeat-containing protein